jgi:hypothetical protein
MNESCRLIAFIVGFYELCVVFSSVLMSVSVGWEFHFVLFLVPFDVTRSQKAIRASTLST